MSVSIHLEHQLLRDVSTNQNANFAAHNSNIRSFFRDVNNFISKDTGDDDLFKYTRGYHIDEEREFVIITDFNLNGLFYGHRSNDTTLIYDDNFYAVRMHASWRLLCAEK